MDLSPLVERIENSTTPPEQRQALQALLSALKQAYQTNGSKGVTAHMKKQLDRLQSEAVTAINELRERL